MKRKNISLYALVVLFSLSTIQSCTSEDPTTFTTQNTYSVPVATAPLNEAVIAPTTTVKLTWAATGGTTKWSVYFGETSKPGLIVADTVSTNKKVYVAEGKKYYWKVVTIDTNGIKTESPLFTFEVDVTPPSPIIYNIDDFVGAYEVTEGTYKYNVNLTKINATTLSNDNFWDMGAVPLWVTEYVFDSYGNVTMTPSTYRATATATTMYSVTGAGTYDVAKKVISVDYKVLKKVYTLKTDGTVSVVESEADSNTGVMVKK